ncbi:MAG: transcriptional regulator [Proteobacteria bacterium]|nr:MAG: transcriptional regulator [Pseudomonadota bacterium]
MSSYSPINALTRGLEVLKAINELGQASVGDIYRLTNLPKPTIVRILETLLASGYIAQSADDDAYWPAAKVLRLSSGFIEAREITRVVAPHIDSFRAKVTWPSDIAIFNDNEMVIINTSRKPGTLSVNRTVGSRVPLLLTALGRAYCAFIPEAARNRIIASIAKGNYPDSRIARRPKTLEDIFRQARRRGYAVSDCENTQTIRAIGVPILRQGIAVGAFNIMVVSNALSLSKLERAYAGEMVQIGEKVAAALS